MAKKPRRTLQLGLTVTVPEGVSDTRAVKLLNQLLKVGYADAAKADADENIDNPWASEVASLKIGTPKILKE